MHSSSGSHASTAGLAGVQIAAAALALAVYACGSAVEPSRATAASAARSAWPNEPAGLVTVTDRVWTELTGNGWNRRDSDFDRIVDDDSDPPSQVLEYEYPAGFAGGTAPATQYYALGGRKELFVGLEWKPSRPWQGHSTGVNKIQFVYTGSSDVAMVMYGRPGGPYEVRVMPQWPEHGDVWLVPNVSKTSPELGRWHRIEWYLKYETRYGDGDGVIRWWLDGALAGDYRAVKFPRDNGFIEYQISPTWGGVGDVKTENDSFRFRRTYISAR